MTVGAMRVLALSGLTALVAIAIWAAGLFPSRDAGGTPAPPAGEAAAGKSVTPGIADLRAAIRERLTADHLYNLSESTQRPAAKDRRNAAKEALQAAIDRFERERGHPLLDDGDALRAAFEDVLEPFEQAKMTAGLNVITDDPLAEFVAFVPESCAAGQATPVVLLAGGGTDPDQVRGHLERTWLTAARERDVVVVAPIAAPDVDFACRPDDTQRDQQARIRTLLAPLGAAVRSLHIDPERFVLDCGRDASVFGLRLAAFFVDRFAGVVLRWPTLDDHLRVEALAGLPVLLLRSPETASACELLHAQLDAQAPGSCTVVDAEDADVTQWVLARRREMMTPQVVVAPMHDRFHRNRWLAIYDHDPVGSPPWHDAPLLFGEVDRSRNRITVKTRGVKAFDLMVGPALVDPRDFTLVVNDGPPERVRLEPSLEDLLQFVQTRGDSTNLFTARHRVVLP